MTSRHPTDDALAALVRDAATTPAGIAAHLRDCADCRARLARFETLCAAVRALPDASDPPDDLWPAIRARLVAAPASVPVAPHRRARVSPRRLAALAASLCLVAAGTVAVVHRLPNDPPPVVATPLPAEPSDAVEAQLLSNLQLQRGRLRPETAAEVDANLRILDSAITEIRGALAREPGSQLLRDLLAASRARKADLLRQTENAS
jgi:hypothetical protein